MNETKTIGELLERYPNGFSVGPAGTISETLLATSYFAAVARQFPVAPTNGGYLVVEMRDEGEFTLKDQHRETLSRIIK